MRTAPLVIFAAVLSLPAAAAAPIHHYHLDEASSRVTAKAAFFGVASKTAGFPRLSGEITLSPADLSRIDLRVDLDARALTAGDSVTLGRLKGVKFFDVARYPTVTYSGQRMTMTGGQTARVEGTLTARGVSRPATLAVTFAKRPAQVSGRDPVDLTGTTTIDRRQFGMTSYGLIVGNKVKITIRARMVPG